MLSKTTFLFLCASNLALLATSEETLKDLASTYSIVHSCYGRGIMWQQPAPPPYERIEVHRNINNNLTILNLFKTKYITSYKIIDTKTGKVKMYVPNDFYLLVPGNTLDPGYYYIIMKQIHKTNRDPESDWTSVRICHFYVRYVKPVAAITGGSLRIVPSRIPLNFSAANSVDNNTNWDQPGSMIYNWSCKSAMAIARQYCDDTVVSQNVTFTMPAKYVLDGDKFEMKLYLKKGFQSDDSMTQTVEVMVNAAIIVINCLKNCPPVRQLPSINDITYMKASCTINCFGIGEENYLWEVYKGDGSVYAIHPRDTLTGGFMGPKLIIKSNVFEPGEYKIVVKLINMVIEGSATENLKFPAPPTNVVKCLTIPPEGTALQTEFLLHCLNGDEASYHYETYLGDSKTGDLLFISQAPAAFEEAFRLPFPGDKKFVVRIYDPTKNVFKEVDLETVVASPLTSSDAQAIEKVIDLMNNQMNRDVPGTNKSVSDILKSRDAESRKKAIQTLQNVVNQMMDMDTRNKDVNAFLTDLKYSVVDDLINSPLMSTTEVEKLTKAFATLQAQGDISTPSDPLLAKLASSICNKMAVKNLEFMKQEKYPTGQAQTTKRVANSLSQCVETNTNPNYEALEPVELNVTTPAPVVKEPVITENYANYEDFDENYYKNIANLQEATNNVINTTSVTAKVMAMSSAIGEPDIQTVTNKTQICVHKDFGKNLVEKTFECQNVKLTPSQDWADDDHPYDLLMTAWKRDLMWWNKAKINVSTDVLNVEFWHSTCKEQIHGFESPVKIYFRIKPEIRETIVNHTFNLTSDYHRKEHHQLNRFIYVRRISLGENLTLRIKFHNLSSHDVYDVTITKFKYPTVEDFPRNKTVTQNESYVQFTNRDNYTIWCYLAVLPNRQAFAVNNNNTDMTISLSFQVSVCLRWLGAEKTWVLACQPGAVEEINSNGDWIICRCNNFSVISGYVRNVESVPQDIIHVEINLKLEAFYVIFAAVMTFHLIYTLLILLTAVKHNVSFYFLADNRKRDRYAYLLVIKTGGGHADSGTTSNIMVKLVGDKKESLPHVLNYPDPELRILQKHNEDLFVLTTDSYLSDIKEIHLWFDGIGSSPSWFCKDIAVYDMQHDADWYFYVNKKLSLDSRTYIIAKPLENRDKKVFCTASLQTFSLYHTWHLSSQQENLTYFKRLTVILSKIMMMFWIVCVYYGVPRWSLNDTLDRREYVIDFRCAAIGMIAAAISFAIHLIITSVFRSSKIQFSKLASQKSKFSFAVTMICWSVIVFSIVIFTSLLLLYGFWMPWNASLMWLISSMVGLAMDVIIYENIVVIVNSFYSKTQSATDIRDKFPNVHAVTETQRNYLYKTFGSGTLFRPYFQHLYQPMTAVQIKKRKLFSKLRSNVIGELVDLLMFGIYIFILYAVILFDRDSETVRSKDDVIDMMNGHYTDTLDFESTENIYNLYDYINETLIPSLQPTHWYGNYTVSDPGLTLDMNNKFLGVVRLRQQRMQSNVCTVIEEMQFLNMTCWPEFSMQYRETNKYGYSWGGFTPYFEKDRLRSIWEYQSYSQINTLPVLGEVSLYPGGGYVSLLGRTLYNSYANFRVLVQKNWIDDKARAVFIEFLMYNVNCNLFNAVRLTLENSATGFVFKTIRVDAVRLVYVQDELTKITFFVFFVFAAWVILLFLRQSINVITRFKSFYRDFWFYLDFIIIGLSIGCVVLKFIRSSILEDYLHKLEKVKHNEFVSYFSVLVFEEILTTVSAFLVCVATIRLWRILRFGLLFRILEKTLVNTAVPLVTLTLALINQAVAFGLWGYYLFGQEFKEFYSFQDIARTVLTLYLRPGQISMPDFVTNNFGYCFFVFYFLLMKVLIVLYISTIMMCYVEAKAEFSEIRGDYTVKSYVSDKIREFPDRFKRNYHRLFGGNDENLHKKSPVEAKSDAFRFADCVQIACVTLDKMLLVAKSVPKNRVERLKVKSLSGADLVLMFQICYHFVFCASEEKETFFTGHLKGQRFSVVDDRRLLKIEAVAGAMLTKNYKKTKKARKKDKVKRSLDIVKINNERIFRCEAMLRSLEDKMDAVLEFVDNFNKEF